MTTLAKYNAGENRDARGRWSGSESLTVPSVRRTLASTATRMLADAPAAAKVPAGWRSRPIEEKLQRLQERRDPAGIERRSLTRGEAWQRIGAKLPELPPGYTGSKDREAPVDGFQELKITPQVPKALPLDEHIKLLGKLKGVIQQNREGAIEKAKVTRQLVAVHGMKDRFTLKRRTGDLILDPQTPKGAVHRAYNHAAMLALHDFGAVDYGPFKMSDAQKTELTPLVPFMRYTRRRLFNAMRTGDLAGKSAPYRADFGKPFADNRTDKITGAVRLRLRPNDQFVKLAPSRLHEADEPGAVNVAADWPYLRLPLAKAFDESEHPRGDGGKFAGKGGGANEHPRSSWGWGRAALGAGLGLAAAVAAPRLVRGGIISAAVSHLGAAAGEGISRGTRPVPLLRTALRGRHDFADHVKDLVHNPVAVGKTPTNKELRRHFLRHSIQRQEAAVVTDAHGKVIHMETGNAMAFGQNGKIEANQLTRPEAAHFYHSHPVDTVPSWADGVLIHRVDADRNAAGLKPLTNFVYSHGQTETGKLRTRITRWDRGIGAKERAAHHPVKQPLSDLKSGSADNRFYDHIGEKVANKAQWTEADWHQFRAKEGSNYRTKAVEKLAKATPIEIRTAAARASLNPTPAQAEAGNYPKGHVRIGGLDMAIETRRGGVRRGTGPDGKAWQVKMPAHYGYVKSSTGADGDAVDVYLGPSAHKADTLPVHVVDQADADSGAFDEHKAMLGFASKEHAIRTYDAGFSDGRGPDRRKAVTTMPFDKFKHWVAGSGPTEPLAKRDTSACVDTRVSGALMQAHVTLRRAGKKHGKGVTDPHVAVAMGDVSRILGARKQEAAHSIASRNEAVRNTRIPLAQILGAAA